MNRSMLVDLIGDAALYVQTATTQSQAMQVADNLRVLASLAEQLASTLPSENPLAIIPANEPDFTAPDTAAA